MRNRITKEDLLLEQWKMASELHRHMDNLIWQHFQHFVTVNGILLSALAVIWSGITSSIALNQSALAFISAAMSFLGLCFSVAWLFIQRRQQKYHHYRGSQARETEKRLIVDNERVLDLYDKKLSELDKDEQERLRVHVDIFARFPTLDLVWALTCLLTLMWAIAMVYFLILWL